MSTLKLAISLFACFSLALVSPVSADDEDIPGVVVVDDEDAFENDIAFTAIVGPKKLGQMENSFVCDLQGGDAECEAFTIDTDASGAVVALKLRMHQLNMMDHRGDTAFVVQKKLVAEITVYDSLIELEEIGEAEGLVTGCSAEATVKDVNGDFTQDKAVWSFVCKASKLSQLVAAIEGDDVIVAQAAAQAAIDRATNAAGKVKVSGKDKNGPSPRSALREQIEDED